VDGVTEGQLETSLVVGTQSVTFNATPTFNSSASTLFRMTLTGNVTSSTISNAATGRIIYFNICQDATGSRTFAWPTSVLTSPTVGTAASFCTSVGFIYDGTNWRALDDTQRCPVGAICVDGVKYATIQAAITAAASSVKLIVVPSDYTGANPASIPSNVTLLDLRGASADWPTNTTLPGGTIISFNGKQDGAVQGLGVHVNIPSPTGTSQAFTATNQISGVTPPDGGTISGIVGEINTVGVLTSVAGSAAVVGIEAAAAIHSTGQTLGRVYGIYSNAGITKTAATTNITDNASFVAGVGVNASTSGAIVSNNYGFYALPSRVIGSTRNYGFFSASDWLTTNASKFDLVDSGGTARPFLVFNASNTNPFVIKSPTAGGSGVGVEFNNPVGTKYNWLLSSNVIGDQNFELSASTSPGNSVYTTPVISFGVGGVVKYNGIATVGGGIPAEYAAVNLTAQTAAVTTTTLYAVPASGAGQYRVSWNAKVTTPATTGTVTSTLGALTIVYTDPDGVVQTITAAASVAAGTIATSSAGNTTATVLLGMPLLLNCKLSTNITYAMAYASNTAAEMQYNLHIVLEKQ
jgi:hypothetical protein